MKWNNVNEILPRNYEVVLIAVYPKHGHFGNYSYIARLEDEQFMDVSGDYFLNIEQDEILYWQSLPKPPKQ
jgi:RNA binding exosome subunit